MADTFTAPAAPDLPLPDEEEKRAGFDPYGQTLPDWLSYSSFRATVDGEVVETGRVVNVPLTYYGPSIPLGEGWTYGGLTSPSTPLTSATMTSSDALPSSPSGVPPDTTVASETPSVPSASSSTAQAVSQSSKQSATTSTVNSTPALVPTPTPLPLPPPPSSILSPTSQDPTASPAPSPQTFTPKTPTSGLLPALLAPLLVLLLLFLLLLILFRRYRRSSSATSQSFLAYLNPFSRTRPSPDAVPHLPLPVPTTPSRHDPADLLKSPDEKSALLPGGYTPQHHRHSSSLSLAGEDELRELAKQNQSLLQRLTLGIRASWAGSGEAMVRKISGNALEKGGGVGEGTVYSAVPTSPRGNGHTRDPSDSQGVGEGGGGGSSGQSQAAAEKILTEDELFFRSPLRTSSTSNASYPSYSSSAPSSHGLPEGAQPPYWSVGVPGTPGTHTTRLTGGSGDRARWQAGGERMEFPVPPPKEGSRPGDERGGMLFGGVEARDSGHKRDSMGSTSSPSFYSAPSAPSIQSSAETPAPRGEPLHRYSLSYRHAALSAFGSHPATPTPTPPHSTSHAGHVSSPLSPSYVQGDLADALRPIRQVFGPSPTPPGGSGEERRSYVGEAMFGEGELQEAVGGRRGGSDERWGEFGELRPSVNILAPKAPTVISRSQQTLGGSSEQASVHPESSLERVRSMASASSGSGTTSAASHGSRAEVPDRALRGRRSKPSLLRASRIGNLALKLPDSG